MNVVDSSGWLAYFAGGTNASFFAPVIRGIDSVQYIKKGRWPLRIIDSRAAANVLNTPFVKTLSKGEILVTHRNVIRDKK